MRKNCGVWSVVFAFTVGASGCWSPEPLQHQPPQPTPPFGGSGGVGPTGPQPLFGPTVSAPVAPPPLSGGTLWASPNGTVAVASDPDVDAIYVVDLAGGRVTGTIHLDAGSEPGRIAVDGANRAHVALRRAGTVVTVDLATAKVVDRTAVCSAPRGIAYDATHDAVLVACAAGELVTLPAAGGAAIARVSVERDLRDVVLAGGNVFVTTLRTAELIEVDPTTGVVAQRSRPPSFSSGDVRNGDAFAPEVAWRAVATHDGRVAVVHQRATNGPVQTTPNGYGGSGGLGQCDGILHAAVSTTDGTSGWQTSGALPAAVLPLDVAASDDGELVVVAAGNAFTPALAQSQLFVVSPSTDGGGCSQGASPLPSGEFAGTPSGQPVAVAMMPAGNVVVQTRAPAGLELLPSNRRVEFPTDTPRDTGHDVFHSNAGGNIACASCHAEGGDDARTWQFAGLGPRRTPSLREGISGTEPFHWGGEMRDLPMLVHEVFVGRMSGPELDPGQLAALRHFLDGIPQLPAITVDLDAAARGQALFGKAGCTHCHSGGKFTNNTNQDVGTGGSFQVPSLINVGWRAPYLHDGRARTLADRFDPSLGGGDRHGSTSGLTKAEIADLVSFLESL